MQLTMFLWIVCHIGVIDIVKIFHLNVAFGSQLASNDICTGLQGWCKQPTHDITLQLSLSSIYVPPTYIHATGSLGRGMCQVCKLLIGLESLHDLLARGAKNNVLRAHDLTT